MTSQLATLSYDHAELAKALEDAGVLTSTSVAAEGGWASAIVGSAVRRTARITQAHASRLSMGPANAWHENAAFGEAVKLVLKNRQIIQVSGCAKLSLDGSFLTFRKFIGKRAELSKYLFLNGRFP